jgi:hypothetical protein
LLAEAKLKPRIEVVEPFDNVDSVAKRLLQREFPGKAVLTFP